MAGHEGLPSRYAEADHERSPLMIFGEVRVRRLSLVTIFGEVRVRRLAYRYNGTAKLEAVLKLRALRANDCWDDYWSFHLVQERKPIHESPYLDGVLPTASLTSLTSRGAAPCAQLGHLMEEGDDPDDATEPSDN